jgi:uncharacterized protein YydD (DUF2326 family)
MIHRISANDERFKAVNFRPGFNILLADTTEESTAQDTRKVGKTLLMEVLQFCLGGTRQRDSGLSRPELTGWTFTADVELNGERVEATRSLGMPGSILVSGNFDDWPVTPTWDKESSAYRLTTREWCDVLGAAWTPVNESIGGIKYRPTFRSVLTYFARSGPGAYESPFRYFSGQREWQKQVSVAYLLDLSWSDASKFQELKDQREALATLKKALKQGAFGDPEQTVGRLRAHRIRLSSQADSLATQLADFEVHPEYRAIATQANELTSRIHDLVNERVVIERTLTLYREPPKSSGPMLRTWCDCLSRQE